MSIIIDRASPRNVHGNIRNQSHHGDIRRNHDGLHLQSNQCASRPVATPYELLDAEHTNPRGKCRSFVRRERHFKQRNQKLEEANQ